MKRINLPKVECADIGFYLALEEWVAKNLPEGKYFFAWQVAPSIICGRHQDIGLEVNLEVARKRGVQVWRRKSGGGAVLADMNNVMFSYISPSTAVETGFNTYTSLICDMLAGLGIEAHPTGRNDIAVGDRKIAGNAFLKLNNCSIVHGTMLVDTDFKLMAELLTPSRAKRESKGVTSVSSRVTTLRALGLTMSCSEFIDYALNTLCPNSQDGINLTDEEINEVMTIRQTYIDPDFQRIAPAIAVKFTRSGYIDGVGQVTFEYTTDQSGCLNEVTLRGDFFPIKDVKLFTNNLVGTAFTRENLLDRISELTPHRYIAMLTADKLIDIIFPTKQN